MADVVARAKTGIIAPVIDIHLRGVTGHRLSHGPKSGVGGAEEVVPEHHVGGEFGIVPGIATHIVFPGMSLGIVVVHHVAIVPEAIPPVLVDGLLVVVGHLADFALHLTAEGGAAVGHAPDAESLGIVKILGLGHQHTRLVEPLSQGCKGFFALITVGGPNDQFRGSGYTIRGAQSFLHILITGIEPVRHIVVMAQVHGVGIRAPQPRGQLSLVGSGS